MEVEDCRPQQLLELEVEELHILHSLNNHNLYLEAHNPQILVQEVVVDGEAWV